MIVFLVTRQHLYTVASLRNGSFGVEVPEVLTLAYEDVLLAEILPRATYIFTDIERLTLFERMLATEVYRALQAAGCRCLNDPAKVMTRYPLLRALHHAGINPFRIWRLDDAILGGMIAPAANARVRSAGLRAAAMRLLGQETGMGTPRFPVFLRTDADHDRPLTGPLPTLEALADAVERVKQEGVPLSGVMIIEFCGEPIAEGIWAKFGTMRIGEQFSTDHVVIEDNWCVRTGSVGLATPAMFEWEHRQVADNAYAAAVEPAFAAGCIEYGRADHATVGGRQVIYEINTNPSILPLAPQRLPIRDETIRIARERFAGGLRAIDGPDGEPVRVVRGVRAERQLHFSNALAMQFRP